MRIPTGWERGTISDVLVLQDNGKLLKQGWSPRCKKHPARTDADWGVLKTTAIQSGTFEAEHHKALPDSLLPRPHLEVAAGDLLLTCAGPRSRCGVPCLVRSTRPRLMISGKMYKMQVSPWVDPSLAEAWLLSTDVQKAIDRMKTGGSDSGLNLTQGRFLQLPFLVAPLAEQRRIATKIEDLFAKLNVGVSVLRRAQEELARYRTSVLQAAVDGRLTKKWRKANSPKEGGEELLGRILAERRKRWEDEQLSKFTAAGRKPPKNWKKQYREPAQPDTVNLPELPDGWCWATVEQLAASVTNGIYKPARFYSDDGIPCLRMYNIVDGELVLRDLKRMLLTEEEGDRYGLVCGDLLVNRVNSRELVGKAAAIPQGLGRIVFESKNMRLRPVGMGYEARFLAYCFAVLGPGYFGRHAQQVVGMASISQNQVGRMVVPVPPSIEQRRIVAAVDRRKRSSLRLEETIKAKRGQSQALRQSILKRAFDGRLVPQDPNDEPASVLLERIRAEQEAEKKRRERRPAKPKGKRKGHVP